MLVSVTDDTKLCVGVNVSTREWCLYLLVSPAIGDLYSILQPVTGEIGSSTAATLSWIRGRKCLNEPINLPRECVQRSGSRSGCFPIDRPHWLHFSDLEAIFIFHIMSYDRVTGVGPVAGTLFHNPGEDC